MQSDAQSGAGIIGGAVGLAGAATVGAFSLIKEARDERRRRQAIEQLTTTVLNEQRPELADILIDSFAASGHRPEFDFNAVVRRYYRQKLYRFLVFTVSEGFADAHFARLTKFESFGLDLPVPRVFDMTAKEVGTDIGSGNALLQKFEAVLEGEVAPYLENARAKGGTTASRHHDEIAERKRVEEEMRKQQELEAQRKAAAAAERPSGSRWGFLGRS